MLILTSTTISTMATTATDRTSMAVTMATSMDKDLQLSQTPCRQLSTLPMVHDLYESFFIFFCFQ